MMTRARLLQVLHYDPTTGVFTWREQRGSRKAGSEARAHRSGYITICIDYKLYQAHRLAWLYVYGVWPDGEIDHKNRIRDDNRISNLRDAAHVQNIVNSSLQDRRKAVGMKGAYKHRHRWHAKITIDSECIYLGTYDTAEQAAEVYRQAALAQWGEFAA